MCASLECALVAAPDDEFGVVVLESISHAPAGVDETYTRLRIVPGIELELSETGDFVGEVGIGLSDDSFAWSRRRIHRKGH